MLLVWKLVYNSRNDSRYNRRFSIILSECAMRMRNLSTNHDCPTYQLHNTDDIIAISLFNFSDSFNYFKLFVFYLSELVNFQIADYPL